MKIANVTLGVVGEEVKGLACDAACGMAFEQVMARLERLGTHPAT
jgi:hypothetical protein